LGEKGTHDSIVAAMKILRYQPLSPKAFRQSPPQDLALKKDIGNLSNLQGSKIRTSRKLDTNLVNAMGGEGVYMAFAEVYLGLQRAVIDGLITGPQAMYSGKMYEVSKYVYTIHLPPVEIWNVVNTEAFEKLPNAYKKILQEESDAILGDAEAVVVPAQVEVSLLRLAANGMTVREPTDAEKAAWKAKAVPLWETWADTPERKEMLKIAKQTMGIQ